MKMKRLIRVIVCLCCLGLGILVGGYMLPQYEYVDISTPATTSGDKVPIISHQEATPTVDPPITQSAFWNYNINPVYIEDLAQRVQQLEFKVDYFEDILIECGLINNRYYNNKTIDSHGSNTEFENLPEDRTYSEGTQIESEWHMRLDICD